MTETKTRKGKRKKVRKDPKYMRTSRFDGRRSVKLEEFVKDSRVKAQIDRIADSAKSR